MNWCKSCRLFAIIVIWACIASNLLSWGTASRALGLGSSWLSLSKFAAADFVLVKGFFLLDTGLPRPGEKAREVATGRSGVGSLGGGAQGCFRIGRPVTGFVSRGDSAPKRDFLERRSSSRPENGPENISAKIVRPGGLKSTQISIVRHESP